jgi:hypothetical protein
MEIIECIIPTKNKPRIYELKVGRREMMTLAILILFFLAIVQKNK